MEAETKLFFADRAVTKSLPQKSANSLVVALLSAAMFPTVGFAQGTVHFATSDAVNHRVLYYDESPAPAGTTVELWWSPNGLADYTRIATTVVGSNGWILPGVVATTGSATPPGSSAWFYIVARTANEYYAQTAKFLNGTGNPYSQPGQPPAELTGWSTPLFLCLSPGYVEITHSPASQFVAVGDALTLSVGAWTSCWLGSPYYQWYSSHGAILGATNSNYVINPVQTNHADNYWVVVSTSYTMRTSAIATVTVLLPGSFTMETSGDSFGVRSNRFGFNITGLTNLVVTVEACTNLANPIWSPVKTNTLTDGVSYFSDAQWTNHPTHFYRLRWP